MTYHEFILTDRFEHAFRVALELHRHQIRKNTHAPFMTHLMAVTAMVCENIGFITTDSGVCEDTAMIAVLHDTVEDQGGMATYQRLVSEFGQGIADGVMMLSDSTPEDHDAKPSKAERNRVYYEKIRQAPQPIALISCCDKIHNLGTMAADFLVAPSPQDFWEAFSASPEDTVANYEKLGQLYGEVLPRQRILVIYERALEGVRSILKSSMGG